MSLISRPPPEILSQDRGGGSCAAAGAAAALCAHEGRSWHCLLAGAAAILCLTPVRLCGELLYLASWGGFIFSFSLLLSLT